MKGPSRENFKEGAVSDQMFLVLEQVVLTNDLSPYFSAQLCRKMAEIGGKTRVGLRN